MKLNRHQKGGKQNFVETPLGIVTQSGNWFFTNSDAIETYVPGLLDEVSLTEIVKTAENWLIATGSLSFILYVIFAETLPVYAAVALIPLFGYIWFFYGASFFNLPIAKLLTIFNSDITLYGLAFVMFSYWGMSGQYVILVFGILYFFVFKIGLVRRLFVKLDDKWTGKNGLLVNDRVLKMALLRFSLREHLRNTDLQNMENSIRELMNKRKKR